MSIVKHIQEHAKLGIRHNLIAEVGCFITAPGRTLAASVTEMLPFTNELYDTANVHSNVTNTTRFYLPPEARWARMFISTDTNKIAAGTSHIVGTYTNVSIPVTVYLRGMALWEDTTAAANITTAFSLMSPLFAVGVNAAGGAGDYMEIEAANLTGAGNLIVGASAQSLFGFEFYD